MLGSGFYINLTRHSPPQRLFSRWRRKRRHEKREGAPLFLSWQDSACTLKGKLLSRKIGVNHTLGTRAKIFFSWIWIFGSGTHVNQIQMIVSVKVHLFQNNSKTILVTWWCMFSIPFCQELDGTCWSIPFEHADLSHWQIFKMCDLRTWSHTGTKFRAKVDLDYPGHKSQQKR